MRYTSTRNDSVDISGSQAIVNGLSPDGGLYVPSSFPTLTLDELSEMTDRSYPERAAAVLAKYLDFDYDTILSFCNSAYSRFDTEKVCPLHAADDLTFILELTHGPTLAFKDMALTLLPYLMKAGAEKVGEKNKILILVATSGDTGKAALEGFKDVEGTEIIVFYPEDGVSEMQKLQMRTQEGGNVHVAGIRGNFDDAQTAVKRIFGSKQMAGRLSDTGYVLSSANSINFGRLAPQIAYYISAYVDLAAEGSIKPGDKINFAVPTGNFGNILAAYYAKKMGLPVNKLICASNSNNILTDFFITGTYDTGREFFKTMSPSMDILISSNLERLLYDLSGSDSAFVCDKMRELKENGKYEVDTNILAKAGIEVGFADEEDTKAAIDSFFDIYDYPLDTHTAVAMTVYNTYVAMTGDNTPTVVVSTASPYKFPVDVYNAISRENVTDAYMAAKKLQAISDTVIPDAISGLMIKPVIHNTVTDIDKINEVVLDFIKR